MYCRNCGAELPESARFCSKCGTQVLRYQPKAKEAETAARDQVDLAALVRDYQASDGDRRMAAFDRLYTASFPKVRAYVQYYARNEETANDCAEEAFMTCLQQLDTLQNPDGYLKWIRTIAYHKFVDRIRKDSKVTAFDVVLDDEGNAASAEEFLADETLPMPEDAYANEELQRLIQDALQNMTVMQQVMIKGHYYDEKSVQTLAEEYGVPVNTVKTHLSRGRNSLKSQIENYANAYGLKLVPLAIVPFMAMLGGQEVKACEVGITAATTAASLASLHAAMGAGGSAAAAGSAGAGAAGAAGSGAAGSGTAAGATATTATGTTAGTTVAGTTATGTATATGATSSSTVAGAATAATGTGTAATAGTAAAGTGIAVKVGAGVIAAAVAAGGAGTAVYLARNNAVSNEHHAETMYERYVDKDELASDAVLTSAVSYENLDPDFANYEGDDGIYAILYHDLDHDDLDELIMLERTHDENSWTLRMEIMDWDGKDTVSTRVQDLATINTARNAEDAVGCVLYLKERDDGDEILCLRYNNYYTDADRLEESLQAYRYREGEIYDVASVDEISVQDITGKSGSENASAYVTVDADQLTGTLKAMKLETSAKVIADAGTLLQPTTSVPDNAGAYAGYISSTEPGITPLCEVYTTYNYDEVSAYEYSMQNETPAQGSNLVRSLVFSLHDREHSLYMAD